eukprot:CAMPEP_0197623926 /NCGR_PEP_ID=MMETSP1338-20131121/3795_1 /TAXON_ID=43686 ORGANISM="Pelagodinium beii, Strain RCC1491" /NCGR_SAMPLE_ID=MMETSP1338 /ASSEMBLY_ACC=CAM_ASM_000754 /LENGTH=364 /DNA_ID=CAMNT_0043194019 /DNA_START=79 /DNA_END=1170 /DNA_ORIENTATION=+
MSSDGGWAGGYAALAGNCKMMAAPCAEENSVPGSGSTRTPSPSSGRSTPRSQRSVSKCRTIRNYGEVRTSELWKWLWVDFSLPPRSPVSRLIKRNMRNHSREHLLDLEGGEEAMETIREEQCVGFSPWGETPLGEGSIGAAVFTLVSSAMGAGCLSLPFMLSEAGLIPGIIMLVVGALLAHLSLVVLMSCARYTDSDSMARLVSLTDGGNGRIVDFAIAVYGIAAALCYLMFIGDFFVGIAHSPLLNLEVSRETVIIGISLVVVWPLSLPRNLSALRHVCVLSVLAICLTALAVAWKAPSYAALAAKAGSGAEENSELWAIKWWNSDPSTMLKSFSIALFAFAAHTNAVPVATSLKKADGGSIW